VKIINLKVENVKRIVAVEITPDGPMVIIGGKNGAGKSSTLDSISYLIGGAALCPKVPIRRGEESGFVEASLGEKGLPELVAVRKFGPKGSTLTIKNAKGFSLGTPQTILDKLKGQLTFDPLAFASMEPIKQRVLLVKLVGLDMADLDEKRKALFDERADAGRDVHGRETQIESMESYPEAGMVETSVADLMAELKKREVNNRRIDKLERDRDAANVARDECIKRAAEIKADDDEIQPRLEAAITELDEELRRQIAEVKLARERGVLKLKADATREHTKNMNTIAECQSRIKAQDATLEGLHSCAVDLKAQNTEEIQAHIEDADEKNRKVRANQARAQLQAQFDEAHAEFERLDKAVQAVDKEKAERLRAAKFPVEGLGFSESGVTMNGLPFEQASSAEQLRVSVAMGMALNPQLRILLIRDGSLLDSDSLRMINDMATDQGYQIWCERVGDGDKAAVVIEDGMVRAEKKGGES
jgi:DNA repair ATPase RecN